MIPASASFLDTASLSVAAWLITYLIHSTLLLGAVWLVARCFRPALAMEDTLWKMALVGAMATALWQVAGPGAAPFGHRLDPVSRAGAMDAATADDGSRFRIEAPVALPIRFEDGDRFLVEAKPAKPPSPASPEDREIVIHLSPERHRSSGTLAGSLSEDDAVAGAATTLSPTPITWTAAPGAAAAPGGARRFLAATGDGLHRLATGLPWTVLLLAAWALGAVAGLLRLALARFRLHRLLRDRREITAGHLVGMLDRLRRAADMRRPVRLSLSTLLAGPVALGRDEICLPRRVLTDLTPGQQHTVLAHELAHLERGDPDWLWLAAAMEAVFFFQPLNRVARRRLRDMAEFLCDDWAVRHGGGNLILARCLAEVAGWVQASPALASGMAQKSSPLVRRIERLLEDRDPFREPGRPWRWLAGLALVAAVAVAAPGITTGSYERPDNAPWTAGPSPWPDYPFVLTPPGWTTTPLSASVWDASPPVQADGQLGEVYGHPAAPAPRSLPPSPREAVRLCVPACPESAALVQARGLRALEAALHEYEAQLHRERRVRDLASERRARWVWQARSPGPENRPVRAPAEPRVPLAIFSGEAESERDSTFFCRQRDDLLRQAVEIGRSLERITRPF